MQQRCHRLCRTPAVDGDGHVGVRGSSRRSRWRSGVVVVNVFDDIRIVGDALDFDFTFVFELVQTAVRVFGLRMAKRKNDNRIV